MEQSSVGYPLLLLDNETLAYILGDGDFRFANLTFDEAKAILDMNAEEDIAKCFEDKDLENAIYEYLGIERRSFEYRPVRQMKVGQDGIALSCTLHHPAHSRSFWGKKESRLKKLRMCTYIVSML